MFDRIKPRGHFREGRTQEKIHRLVQAAVPDLAEGQVKRLRLALTRFWGEVRTASHARALIFASAPGDIKSFFLITVRDFSPESSGRDTITDGQMHLSLRAMESLQEAALSGAGVIIFNAFQPPTKADNRDYRSLLDSLPYSELYGSGAGYLGAVRSRRRGAKI